MIKSTRVEYSSFAELHPIVNFTYFVVVIGISMFSMHPIFLGMTFFVSFYYSIWLKGKKAIKFNLGSMLPIIVFMAVINPLFVHRGKTVLFYLNGNAMTLESILYGVAAASMLTSVIIWFSCYSIIMTSDKFIYLFGRIMPKISLVLSMCFRFIPMLKNRFKEISEGQKCMGRNFSKANILKRGRQLCKEVSILIAWSLEASIETADSMEARGYGLKGRSSFSIFKFDTRDGIVMFIITALFIIVGYGCCIGENNILYYPEIIIKPISWSTVIILGAYFMLLLLPIIIDVLGDLKWKELNLEK